jgi:hypothetical protein
LVQPLVTPVVVVPEVLDIGHVGLAPRVVILDRGDGLFVGVAVQVFVVVVYVVFVFVFVIVIVIVLEDARVLGVVVIGDFRIGGRAGE